MFFYKINSMCVCFYVENKHLKYYWNNVFTFSSPVHLLNWTMKLTFPTFLQRNSMDSIGSIYSLSSGSLPSHFRSVSPKPEVCVTIETDNDKSPSRCSTRTVYIILAAIFIVSSSIAVTIAVHEIQRVIEESAAILPVSFSYFNISPKSSSYFWTSTIDKISGVLWTWCNNFALLKQF